MLAVLLRQTLSCAFAFGLGAAAHAGDCPRGAAVLVPGQSIQKAVEEALPGASFCLTAGLYRLQAVKPKQGQRFYGDGVAILSGSRVVTEFRRDGRHWVAEGVRLREQSHGECLGTSPACGQAQPLLVDGGFLTQVLHKDELGPSRYYVDRPNARIYVADDPRGRLVELSTTEFAFSGSASDVQIRGLVIEKYASPAQHGAIHAQDAKGWLIESSTLRWNAGGGISIGAGGRVRGCDIHHNGQIGVTGVGHDIKVEANRIWANNTRGFSMGWEAGGVKLSLASRALFRANRVHDNRGPGLWCDGDCRDAVYEDNIVERNHGAGIFHEISFHAVVRRNVLRHNGLGDHGWIWGNDILISASEGVEVHDNHVTSAPGKCAIMLVDQGRTDDGKRYRTRSNHVHGNDIRFDEEPCAGAASDVEPGHENYAIITQGGNRFDRNTYRIPRDTKRFRFVWGHEEELDWDALRQRGLEPDGRLLRY